MYIYIYIYIIMTSDLHKDVPACVFFPPILGGFPPLPHTPL